MARKKPLFELGSTVGQPVQASITKSAPVGGKQLTEPEIAAAKPKAPLVVSPAGGKNLTPAGIAAMKKKK